MISSTQIDVSAKVYTGDNNSAWQMKKDVRTLGRVESRQLDITTIHRMNMAIAFVVWRPYFVCYDSIQYIQFMEQIERMPYLNERFNNAN
jgi:hypothetical protein